MASFLPKKERRAQEIKDLTNKLIDHRHRGHTVEDTCSFLGIGRTTYYKYLKENKDYDSYGQDHLYTRFIEGGHKVKQGDQQESNVSFCDEAFKRESNNYVDNILSRSLI